MSVAQFNQSAYGLTQSLIDVFPQPIISNRAPAANDKAQLGTTWIDVNTNAYYVITSIVANAATWVNLSSSAGGPINQIDTTTGNAIPVAGIVNIVGGGSTNIATSATGNTITVAVISSPSFAGTVTAATGFVATTGNIVASTGNITSTLGSMHAATTITAGTGITSTTGNIVASAGNISATLGSLSAGTTVTAGTGVTATTGNVIITAGNLALPASIAAGTAGFITVGGANFISNIGNNVAIGVGSGTLGTTGTNNASLGYSSFASVTSGTYNVALGSGALELMTSGSHNVAVGSAATAALADLLTGSANIAIGSDAGSAYVGAESSNIVIGNIGVAAESNVIRIGTDGSGAGQQDLCYIAGIFGVTVDAGTGVPVVVDSTGKLGTVVSSRRFKDNIESITRQSESIYKLNPVSFSYKSDVSKTKNYGLIAEEVHEAMPELVVYDAEKNPFTVRYGDLIPMMLNEMKKLQDEVSALKKLVSCCK